MRVWLPPIARGHPTSANVQAITNVNFFYNAQQVGSLPQSTLNEISWIKSSLPQEATAGPLGRDMSGGWLTGGAAYSVKATIPTAFTVVMLAWSLIRCGRWWRSPPSSMPC